jgi:hypothetical protein
MGLERAAGPSDAARTRWEGLLAPLAVLRKQSTLWELELARVLEALGGAGVSAVVLKGGALRHTAYERPLERWMGDLDLLVAPPDLDPTLALLATLGYTRGYSDEAKEAIETHHYHQVVSHPSGFIVEVHERLTRPGAACQLDHEEFLARARPLQWSGGTTMLVPSPADMLLHLASQIEQEGCRRLSRIVDVDRTVLAGGELDWEDIRFRAVRGHLDIALAVSLRFANLLLGTPVPDWARDGRGLPTASRRGIESIRPVSHLLRPREDARVASIDLVRLWLLPSWKERRAMLRALATRRSDPLEWIWEGKDTAAGEENGRATGGPGRLAKLVAYQLWTGTLGGFGSGRAHGVAGRPFWDDPPATGPASRIR